MMTSRAEYRLLLRQDNADIRLTKIGHDIGLIGDERLARLEEKVRLIDGEIARVTSIYVNNSDEVQYLLEQYASTPLHSGCSLAELIRRPELSYEAVAPIDPGRKPLPAEVCEQVNIHLKYEGYIRREMQQVERFRKLEGKRIPENIDYDKVESLRSEARQKLKSFRPSSIGQASRIAGVSPADISVLMVYLKKH